MDVTPSKYGAVAVVLGWAVFGCIWKGWSFGVLLACGMLFPLSVIWFADIYVNFPSWRIRPPEPPWLLVAVAWVFLLGFPVLVVMIALTAR